MSDNLGWNVLKVIGIIACLLGMVGFGFCSLLGFGFAGRDVEIWLLALLGAALSALSLWGLIAILRSMRGNRGRE